MKIHHGLLLLAMFFLGAAGCRDMPARIRGKEDPLAALRAERARLAHQPRRLIFNNDGDDQGQTPEATIDGFLAVRTTPLADSQVDTISYSTDRGSFGRFSHLTTVGQTLAPSEWQTDRYRARGHVSVLPAFLANDTDPLQEMIHWAREHGREIFWSLRMNDTHDTAWPEEEFPDFKKQRPDLLMGARDRRPPHGAWSAMNFALPEVRDLSFRFVEEVCRNYDVDGVELDFFRMLQYFPVVAWGGEAGDEERAMMTDLLRRIRRMTEEEGLRRGRPILLAARTPDSVDYCRAIGLDLETWLAENLLDIYIAGGDVRMNHWNYSVALARRHGVALWADLDPVIRNAQVAGLDRNAMTTLRGRALEAWVAGANAIYMFNHFNPRHPLWHELGDPMALAAMERTHFLDVKGFSGYHLPTMYLAGGERFYGRPRLHPDHPLPLAAGEKVDVEWNLPAGSVPAASHPDEDHRIRLTAHIGVFGLSAPETLRVWLNGRELGPLRQDSGGRVAVDLPPGLYPGGRWTFQLAAEMGASIFHSSGSWPLRFDGRSMPSDPWSHQTKPRTVVALQDGALRIADQGTEQGDYQYVSAPWGLADEGRAVIEARVRVVGGMNAILFGSGTVQQRLELYPDRLRWGHPPRTSVALDTRSDFRHYRIEVDGTDLRLYADGQLLMETPGGFSHAPGRTRRQLAFGAGTSPETGEALWSFVRARVDPVSITDLAVHVDR